MNDTEAKVLNALIKGGHDGFVSAEHVAKLAGVDVSAVHSVAISLVSHNLVSLQTQESITLSLTEEGMGFGKMGTPERRLVKTVGKAQKMVSAVIDSGLDTNEQRIALQWAFKNKWLRADKGEDGSTLLVRIPSAEPPMMGYEQLLSQFHSPAKVVVAEKVTEDWSILLSRGLAVQKTEKRLNLHLNADAAKKALSDHNTISGQLSAQMLKDGSWIGKSFRPYDLSTVAAPMAQLARKHVYREFIDSIKLKLVGLGFKEVHGPLVELEFWNMDALYMAQDHPSRDIHDIFRIKKHKGELEPKLATAVKKAHENGGTTGSRGWEYQWDPEMAARLVLRSQTTTVSARSLAKGLPSPSRLFCIGRVFRPDEIDWKHFIEFNQCEGIVLDKSMTFRDHLGYIKTFAKEVFGAKDVKFIPHYYPFTEPSVDIAVKMEGRGYVEVGGTGMFRPEMLEALGVDSPVLAWGLGLDRLAMLSLGIEDMRELFSKDISFLRSR